GRRGLFQPPADVLAPTAQCLFQLLGGLRVRCGRAGVDAQHRRARLPLAPGGVGEKLDAAPDVALFQGTPVDVAHVGGFVPSLADRCQQSALVGERGVDGAHGNAGTFRHGLDGRGAVPTLEEERTGGIEDDASRLQRLALTVREGRLDVGHPPEYNTCHRSITTLTGEELWCRPIARLWRSRRSTAVSTKATRRCGTKCWSLPGWITRNRPAPTSARTCETRCGCCAPPSPTCTSRCITRWPKERSSRCTPP